jgi:hypothetical protein
MILIKAMTCVGFLTWVDKNISKRNVGSIKGLPKFNVSVEEVFKMKYRTVSRRVACERIDELRMTAVNSLQRLSLMLHRRPSVP